MERSEFAGWNFDECKELKIVGSVRYHRDVDTSPQRMIMSKWNKYFEHHSYV
jgi:hypothetical protein